MARDTLLGFPAHTLPYRRGKFITLSTASCAPAKCRGAFLRENQRKKQKFTVCFPFVHKLFTCPH